MAFSSVDQLTVAEVCAVELAMAKIAGGVRSTSIFALKLPEILLALSRAQAYKILFPAPAKI